jgi:hypothetical protein
VCIKSTKTLIKFKKRTCTEKNQILQTADFMNRGWQYPTQHPPFPSPRRSMLHFPPVAVQRRTLFPIFSKVGLCGLPVCGKWAAANATTSMMQKNIAMYFMIGKVLLYLLFSDILDD